MTAWLDVLRSVLPARGVLLVGAGAGNGAWARWLQTRSVAAGDVPVYLVEGDEEQYRHLQRSLGAGTGCTPWRDVVAPGAGRATFHRASNPAESGLLPPQALQQLWPNLGGGDAVTVEDATTLDALRAEIGRAINWLVLDCLPAATLLQGGANLLPQLDVALVRVASDLPPELQAHQLAADELLRAAGLRRIHSQAERHPSLSHDLYVRDTERQIRKLQESQDQAHKAAQEAWVKEKEKIMESRAADGQVARYLVNVPLQLNASLIHLGFNAQESGQVRVDKTVLNYKTKGEKPLYLVSNSDGNPNTYPITQALSIEPSTNYVLTGCVGREGGGRPNVWIYQYDGKGKMDGQFIPVGDHGEFQLSFRTLKATQTLALGLRLSGSGRLMLSATKFHLQAEAQMAWSRERQELFQLNESIVKENEGLRKQLSMSRKMLGADAPMADFSFLDQLIDSLKLAQGEVGEEDEAVLEKACECLKSMVGQAAPVVLDLDRIETSSGPLALVHVRNDYIPTKVIKEKEYYELEFLRAMSHFHASDGLVLDVGANIGNHAIYFARVLGAKVVAFEPQPHNVLCLELNAIINSVRDMVTVHRCALGRTPGEAVLSMCVDSNYGTFSAAPLADAQTPDASGPEYGVPVRVLDEVLKPHHPNQKVSLLKIDVEGMELDVLRGAKETIKKWKPFIACECFSEEMFKQIEIFLYQFNYSAMSMLNATPTFLFYCATNPFHMTRLAEHLRHTAVLAASKKKGFLVS